MLKNVIGKIRKFFWNYFNIKTSFIRLKRRRSKFYFLHCLKNYVWSIFEEDAYEKLITQFGNYTSPKDIKLVAQHKVNPSLKEEAQDTHTKLYFAFILNLIETIYTKSWIDILIKASMANYYMSYFLALEYAQ